MSIQGRRRVKSYADDAGRILPLFDEAPPEPRGGHDALVGKAQRMFDAEVEKEGTPGGAGEPPSPASAAQEVEECPDDVLFGAADAETRGGPGDEPDSGGNDAEGGAKETERKEAESIAKVLMRAKSYAELSTMEIDESKTLLGKRYLCAGRAMIFIGQAGNGKSTAGAYQDIYWAAGLPAFGIQPSRPLRILTIQCENDEGDMIEMARDILSAGRFSEEHLQLIRQNAKTLEVRIQGEAFLTNVLWPAARSGRFDIIRIDPLFSFGGFDLSDRNALLPFLGTLDRIMEETGVALILNHHPPKVINRDTSQWSAFSWMYSGAGGAELANWARALLVLDPLKEKTGFFRLIAAKRGNRLRWVDEGGDTTLEMPVAWNDDGTIGWREIAWRDIQDHKAQKEEREEEARREWVYEVLSTEKAVSVEDFKRLGRKRWAKHAIDALRRDMEDDGTIQRIAVARRHFLTLRDCATLSDDEKRAFVRISGYAA